MEQMDIDFDPPKRYTEWYDGKRGWENDHVGWYEHVIFEENWKLLRPKLLEIVDYLYDRVDNCERHCRWTHGANYIRVKFRYERDALLFTLRF
jgi:hypothetical protein